MSVNVGFAARDLTPKAGVPLSGYGSGMRRSRLLNTDRRCPHAHFFKPSTGVLDPIRAKAVVLEREGRRLLFISLDLLAISPDLHVKITSELIPLGFEADAIFVSATHTHSGPGTLSRGLIWQALMTDLFQPEICTRFVAGVVDVVRDADAARQPATLHAVAFVAEGLQRNRQHAAGFYDPAANMLLARSAATGRWMGAMVNLAVHGTAMPAENLLFSADVPGGIERALQESLGAPVMFVNGAEGDVSPMWAGLAGIEFIGTSFAAQAMAALPRAREIAPNWSVQRRLVNLGRPRMNPRNFAVLERFKVSVGLGMLLPRHAPLSIVTLGDMMLLAWPGEPTTNLGVTVKDAARRAGAAQAWVLGLTNGYAGYFVTPDEYRSGGYEARSAFYGPNAGTLAIDEFKSMLGTS